MCIIFVRCSYAEFKAGRNPGKGFGFLMGPSSFYTPISSGNINVMKKKKKKKLTILDHFGHFGHFLDHFGPHWPLWPKTPCVISQPEMIPDSKAWFYFKYTIEKLASMDRFWLWGAFFGRGIRKCLF